jgi:hypothetical protein
MSYDENADWLREVLHESEAVNLIDDLASELRDLAISYSPDGDNYQASFAEKSVVIPEFAPQDVSARAAVTLEPRWHIIEFGRAKYLGVHSPPYGPIRRATTSLGLEWDM